MRVVLEWSWWWWSIWQLMMLQSCLATTKKTMLTINRQHQGDMFTTQDAMCSSEVCVGMSSGTASVLPQTTASQCPCQCLQHLPVFRDDLQICVDDIHECPLASFLSGTTFQKIPYVFLPLRGQIVYPSAEISFSGLKSPICVVSGARFLTGGGWASLHNRSDSEPPFRLYRDEGRTFLQWLGESELRISMEGRLLLVHLMCKDIEENSSIFTPCVAFRVAGTPSVREVSFSADAHATDIISNTPGFSPSEYITIGVCSILLGLIYVASVLLFLHTRRRQEKNKSLSEEGRNPVVHLTEEGIVKNNPLLRHCHENGGYLSDSVSCCSETEGSSDIGGLSEELTSKPKNVTCAMVHPCTVVEALNMTEPIHQESSAIERLPEENVSIVETLEGKEDRPESVRPIVSATARKKLYFNPAYFELELLMAPPPAALEFLTKIREVIAIAKHKMAAKRFLPSLLGIPEENENYATNINFGSGNNVNQKKGRQKRYPCDGCPGCLFVQSNSLLKEVSYLPCCDASNENKHQSIQKWLEDVTVSKPININDHEEIVSNEINLQEKICNMPSKLTCQKISNSKTNFEEITHLFDQEAGDCKMFSTVQPNVENTCSAESSDNSCEDDMLRKNINCSNETAMQINKLHHKSEHNDNESDSEDIVEQNTINNKYASSLPPPPPPSTCSSLNSKHNVVGKQEGTNEELFVPEIAKKLMDAVIKEFVDQRAHECNSESIEQSETNKVQVDTLLSREYESDSLERILSQKDDVGMRTPSDYGDVLEKSTSNIEKQTKIDDTLENNVHTDSFLNTVEQKVEQRKESKQIVDDHEYEVISLNPENKSNKFILPDILSRGEGYSLVSEVYVNDSYSFSSTSSLPSNHSSSASNEPKIKYTTENPGQLTIEVEDSPSNYEKSYDSDNFEPDTLDRKPNKLKINNEDNFDYNVNRDSFSDSLERPTHISLKTTGSFRSDSLSWDESSRFSNIVNLSPLTRTFGSLREIFEARNRFNHSANRSETLSPVCSTRSLDTDCYSTLSWKRGKPKFLRPDPRQAKRQRQPSPPDCAPPRPPKTIYSNENILQNMLNYRSMSPPLPPRSIKPPLPPKNGSVRSTSQQSVGKKQNCRVLTNFPTSSLMTRGILASASGSSPPSSDYETIDNKQNQCDYKKNISLSEKIHSPRGRNNTIVFKSPRDKTCLNYHRKVQLKMSIVPHRTEDSGYLSSDSAGSESKRRDESLSETDDSLCDGASESGAESIATDSFFFGNFHKLSVSNSVDSGMCTGAASIHSDSDSNISFVTVLPTDVYKKQQS